MYIHINSVQKCSTKQKNTGPDSVIHSILLGSRVLTHLCRQETKTLALASAAWRLAVAGNHESFGFNDEAKIGELYRLLNRN